MSIKASRALITPPLGSTLSHVKINNQANLSIETLAALEGELPRCGTLYEFALWGNARRPLVSLLEAIDWMNTRTT